jgi:hypothetical protein
MPWTIAVAGLAKDKQTKISNIPKLDVTYLAKGARKKPYLFLAQE